MWTFMTMDWLGGEITYRVLFALFTGVLCTDLFNFILYHIGCKTGFWWFPSSSPFPFPFPLPHLYTLLNIILLCCKRKARVFYTEMCEEHMHLSNAWSQNKSSLFISHIAIKSLWENLFNLCSDLKSKNSKEKILLRALPWINFISLFIWPFSLLTSHTEQFYLLEVGF